MDALRIGLDFFQNIGSVGGFIFIFYFINRSKPRVSPFVYEVLKTIFFLLALCLSMLQSVKLPGNLYFDSRNIIVALSCLFGGPITGLVTLLTAIIVRIVMAGPGLFIGISGVLSAFILGMGFYFFYREKKPSILSLFLFGLFLSLLGTFWPFIMLPLRDFLHMLRPAFLIYPLVILGTLYYGFLFRLFQIQSNNRDLLKTEKKEKNKLLELFDGAVFFLQEDQIIHINELALILFRDLPENVLRNSIYHFFPKKQKDGTDSIERFETMKEDALLDPDSVQVRFLILKRKNNHPFECEARLALLSDSEPPLYVLVLYDMSEGKRKEFYIEMAEHIFKRTADAIMVTDLKGKIIKVNRSFCKLTGYSEEEILGRTPSFLRSNRHTPDFYKQLKEALLQNGHWKSEIWNRKKNGEAFAVWEDITALKDQEGNIQNFVAILQDQSQVKKSQQQIEYNLQHDNLTGLPKREMFLYRLQSLLEDYQPEKGLLAVCALDIVEFNSLNTSYGHFFGDIVLKNFSDHLKEVLGTDAYFARLGGDEFLVLFTKMKDNFMVANHLDKLKKSLESPLLIDGKEIFLAINAGVSIAQEPDISSQALISQADAALKESKRQGGGFRFSHSRIEEIVRERIHLTAKLRRAISEDKLYIHYQPKLDISQMRIVGMEALVRWEEENETIPPSVFIPLAEDNGLILSLGEYVFRRSCEDMVELVKEGYRDIKVAVNLSGHQFSLINPVKQIAKIMEETKISADNLVLEITESAFINKSEVIETYFHQIRDMDIEIALDDFGTGYSSLSYLQRLPISCLKIDKSFVDNLPGDQRSVSMFVSITAMAISLGLSLVAEGVETTEQLNFIKMTGCDQIQGYWFSKPLSLPELKKLLKEYNQTENKLQ